MSKKAILVVSFGTSYPETRALTLDALETDFRNEFSDYDIYSAYTSNIIRRKLKKRDNIEIMSPFEALDFLYKEGYEEVYVQSLHIINGFEFVKIKKAIMEHEDDFKKLEVGHPLLTELEDYDVLVEALSKQFPNLEANQAIVLMGHGTEHFSNAAYPALERVFRAKGNRQVYIGTVEGFPEIDEVMQELKHDNVQSVILMPMMIVAGDHATNDLAGDDEDSWKSMLLAAGYDVTVNLKGMGENPEIRKIYLEHAKQMFK